MWGGMHRRPRIILAAAFLVAILAIGSAGAGSGYGQKPPSNTAAPTITGTPVSGSVLAATTGSWTGVTIQSYSYQWQRCGTTCAAVPGATSPAYTLTAADVGSTFRVTVTATNKNGS